MQVIPSDWAVQITNMPLDEFVAFTAITIIGGLAGIYLFFRYSFRARLVQDVPTSKVRSAAQGYVELMGRAMLLEGEPIRSPLTSTICCWWRYKIESNTGEGSIVVESHISDSPFLLEDDTGRCLVDPEGASVIGWEEKTWDGDSHYPVQTNSPSGFSFLNDKKYHYTEKLILPGSPLFVIGQFRSLGELDHRQSRNELTSAILRDWKQDRAALLARFDRNGDGEIDMQEWEAARQAAAQQAEQDNRESQQGQMPNILEKPRNKRQPFILAAKRQDDLTWQLHTWAGLALVCGLFGSGLALFLLLNRFAGLA